MALESIATVNLMKYQQQQQQQPVFPGRMRQISRQSVEVPASYSSVPYSLSCSFPVPPGSAIYLIDPDSFARAVQVV